MAARARQTGFPLAAVAEDLGAAGRRLDTLDAGDPATQVRAVFSWSYAALAEPARRLFRLLSVHPGPEVGPAAAASLAGVPVDRTRSLLGELTRASLLGEPAPGRFTIHDLLRTYAQELAEAADDEATRRGAWTRLLDHFVHTASAAERLLRPRADPTPVPLDPPAPGVVPDRLDDDGQATRWLVAERSALQAMQRKAVDAGFGTRAWQLAWALDTFLYRQARWAEAVTAWANGLAPSDPVGDPAALALAHRRWADYLSLLGRHADADAALREALTMSGRAGDPRGQAHAYAGLGIVYLRQGELDRAVGHTEQALALHRTTGDRRGQALVLNDLGWMHIQLGRHTEAVRCCEEALELLAWNDDHENQAATLDTLASAHHHLGHHAEAIAYFRRCLTVQQRVGDRYNEAGTLDRLADSLAATGDPAAARASRMRALEILTELGHPDADALRARLAVTAR
jgi:tetratricopeptide (TPR) repeat protein